MKDLIMKIDNNELIERWIVFEDGDFLVQLYEGMSPLHSCARELLLNSQPNLYHFVFPYDRLFFRVEGMELFIANR